MGERFRAFSFVDRIVRIEPGVRIEGRYTVPARVSRFPASLMAEAVGQLAAWAAMAQLDFRVRPVAGLAAETRYGGAAQPGDTLELAVAIERCDEGAVAYSGSATVNGVRYVELLHTLGPMLPMEDFDDPAAVRADFETLVGPGAPADRFGGVPAPSIEVVERAAGERLRAELQVPEDAAFFADHFPRRPVFPGTLLLDAQSALALELAGETAPLRGAALAVRRITDVKIRSFTPPGQRLELRVELVAADASGAVVALAARANGKSVATARAEIGPRSVQ